MIDPLRHLPTRDKQAKGADSRPLRYAAWRPGFARLFLGAGLVATAPTSGHAAPLRLPVVTVPALPTGEGPSAPPPSSLEARLVIPLEAYRRELDLLLPREIRAAGVEEQVTAEEVLKQEERDAAGVGVRWRGPIRRGSFVTEGRADTLYSRVPVHYRLEIEGNGFPPTSCGVGSDSLTGLVSVATRFAWGDGWRLESRSRPLAVVYPTRCKPRPPAINFTKLVDDRIKSRLLSALVPTLDSLWAATDLAPRVRALHAAVGRPLPLRNGGPWLHWRPGEIRAERPRLEGDAVVVDLAVVTAPTILPTAEATAVELPAAPRQRLFESATYLPIDCWVDFSEIASRLTGLAAAAGGQGSDSVRVARATPRGAGDRIVLELELEGAVTGRAFLVGWLRCAEPRFALEIPDLAWSDGTRQALADAAPAGDAAAAGAALDELLEQAKSRLRFDLAPCVTRWNRSVMGALAARREGEVRFSPGFAVREVSEVYCTGSAVGVRVIESGRVRLAE